MCVHCQCTRYIILYLISELLTKGQACPTSSELIISLKLRPGPNVAELRQLAHAHLGAALSYQNYVVQQAKTYMINLV